MKKLNYSHKLQSQKGDYTSFTTLDAVFTKEECQTIIDMSAQQKFNTSLFKSSTDNRIQRKTDIYWLKCQEESQWIFERIIDAVNALNSNIFKFDLVGSIASFQIGKYSEGHGYDWHRDIGSGSISRRKLSVSVQLSESDSYEGGDLLFFGNGHKHNYATRKIGSLVVFPSYEIHKVTNINKGERWSMVNWMTGTPFR